MKKSRVLTLGLACFLGAVTTFSALAGTLGGGGVFSHETRINTDNSGSQRLSAEEEKIAAEMQAELLAGTLELDPENDPVIYTTDYGLDIHWHMAGLPANSANMLPPISSGKFTGYAYINHGGVNWAIIGYSNKTYSLSGVINLTPFITYYSNYSNSNYSIFQTQDSDAANAIYSANVNQSGSFYSTSSFTAKIKSALFPNAKSSNELECNEVLCFAQNMFSEKSTFRDSLDSNCYYNSRLMTTMNTFYNNNLTDLPIAEKTLKTVWDGASDETTGSNLTGTYKIFPLAGISSSESFYVLNYLTEGSDAIKQSSQWWLRSGISSDPRLASYVHTDGSLTDYYVGVSYGVRPAFVLKIT